MTTEHNCALPSPILTEAEAIRWLRLDENGPANPKGTLKFYRSRGLLHAVKIGRQLRYPVSELERFVERLLEREAARR